MSAERISVSGDLAAAELFYERGWADGLPVVAPTPARVEAMLQGADLGPEAVLGSIPARRREITAEQAAISAVMAGCRPQYFAVLAAMVEAVCEPAFSVHGPTATTAGTAVLTVVNGPVRQEIGLNSGANLFGPGSRAGAALGRALRLLLRNAAGATPEEFDRAALSHPGKPGSDRLLARLGEHLQRECGVRRLVPLRKESAYRPAPPEVLSLLAERCHAVITGVGD